MNLFNGVILIEGVSFLMFSLFAISFIGYLLGRITIKNVSLGTAGTFIIALIYGAVFSSHIKVTISQKHSSGEKIDISSNALKILENSGLILFIASVGFISGPTFFSNLKKNFKSYFVIGLVIILSGTLTTVACFYIGKKSEEDTEEFIALIVGIFSGSLTSTPAFSAAKATADSKYEDAVTVGYGIAYLFGVLGVVIFVQIIPKILRANLEEEKKIISQEESNMTDKNNENNENKNKTDDNDNQDNDNKNNDNNNKTENETQVTSNDKNIENNPPTFFLDPFGFCVFSFAAVAGIFVGAIRIPLSKKLLNGSTFSLTTTGGVLIISLIIGHFGRICKLSLTIEKNVLKVLRELGLMLFLIGAGVSGGAKFVDYFKGVYFAYGIFITLIPMIIGFIFAKFVFKLPLLNNLGSITGGMTSTPALGTLINMAKTDEVAGAYAATYPISLIAIVFASQLLILLLN